MKLSKRGRGLEKRATRNVAGSSKRPWLVPVALIALSLVPIAAGVSRVSQVARGVAANADNSRFLASPLPVVCHVIGATLFCVLGALQFGPIVPRPRWHSGMGYLALPAGLVAALSGLWMTFVYPLPTAENHPLLRALRLVLGVGMLLALLLSLLAIRRRDFRAHRAWVVRGYAIGSGAGTQALILVPWWLLFGTPTGITYALIMGACWALNLCVAERLV